MVKVKAHRGEPANEGADILAADKAISDMKVSKEWCQRTTFNNSVMDAIRRGAAENEVQKHEEKLTGAA